MSDFILNLPLFVAIFFCLIVSLLFSFLVTLTKKSKSHIEILKSNHDLTSYIFNAFGLIYAVLVAFVVFATWGDFQEAKMNSEMEANEVQIIYALSNGFKDEKSDVIKDDLRKYINILINDEWDLLSEGKVSLEAAETLLKIKNTLFNLEITSQKDSDIFQSIMERLNSLVEYRKMRIINAEQSVPAILWFILLCGYFTSIIFTYFFVSTSKAVHFSVVSALIFFNTLILYMILVLDNPFTGFNKITTEPLLLVKEWFEIIDHMKNQ